MVALKTKDISDEQLPVMSRHPEEASVEAIRTDQERKWIEPQHFDRGCKPNVVGEEQNEGQDFTGFVGCGDHHADAAGAEVDGFLSQLGFRVIRRNLNADRQRDGDAIEFTAFSSRWL